MNPVKFILAVGMGYLVGNPYARKSFLSTVQKLTGSGIDALAKLGDDNALQSMVSRPADRSGELDQYPDKRDNININD